jgi:hypothetical protein
MPIIQEYLITRRSRIESIAHASSACIPIFRLITSEAGQVVGQHQSCGRAKAELHVPQTTGFIEVARCWLVIFPKH